MQYERWELVNFAGFGEGTSRMGVGWACSFVSCSSTIGWRVLHCHTVTSALWHLQ